MDPAAPSRISPGAFRTYGVLAVAGVAALGFMSETGPFFYAFTAATCLLALAITMRAASLHEARLLVVLLLAMVVVASRQPGSPHWLWRLQTQAGFWGFAGAFLRLSAVFPHRLRPADLRGGSGPIGRLVAGVERLALRPSVVWGGATFFILAGMSHDLGLLEGIDMLRSLMILGWLVMLLLALHLLATGYRLSDASQRFRAWWMVAGLGGALTALAWFVVFGIAPALLRPLPDGIDTVLQLLSVGGLLLAPFLILAGVAFAVFYRGALDPALMIRRTTIVSGLGIVLIVVFATLENLLTESVVGALSLPPISGELISGAVIAIVVTALQDRIRGWLSADRGSGTRIDRARGDAGTEDA